MISDDKYFPQYVSEPVDDWLNTCDRIRTDVEMYSDNFLQTFENSDFFTTCKKTVAGKFEWKKWSDCSVSCGEGSQTKIAIACVPEYAICYGIPILERSCNDQVCPVGQWTWNHWSECTASCDGGLRFRTANSCEPFGADCTDIPVLKESCNTAACPVGQWTWNDWGECSNSCGGGIKIRTADQCLPEGAVCEEVPIIEEKCNEDPCPEGKWNWNPWSDCSVSCGGGTRTKTPNSCVPENAICNEVPILEETCNEDKCPVGSWSWNEWGDCSVSCGGGSRIKTAELCIPKGAICDGSPVKEESCGLDACPVGSWTWNEWGDCSNSCGGGTRIKIADQCLPQGAVCEEVPIKEEPCNENACPEGQWNWNPWSDCSVSCGGGKRTRTPNSCVPENAICNDVPILEETCHEEACPIGIWSWNEWGDCSVSCGGGVRTRIPNSCEPKTAICNEIPILEESCNPTNCPDMPSPYLPAGTVISWVPRPNKNAPDSFNFDDDTWIECNGIEKCKSGRFQGQFCSDLSDRVLVGAGKLGQILDLKDASFPDHAHKHRHTGSKTYSIAYKKGPDGIGTKKKGHDSSYASDAHQHNINAQTSVNVNFADMSEEETLISNFKNPNSKITKSSGENELYSPHMRVTFMFKCY